MLFDLPGTLHGTLHGKLHGKHGPMAMAMMPPSTRQRSPSSISRIASSNRNVVGALMFTAGGASP